MKHFAPVAGGDTPEAADTVDHPGFGREENNVFPRHVGGGWWELSNGERVKSKSKAKKAESSLP
jgi:hypothetical protein